MKKIEDLNLLNKTVIIRVDFNVPLDKNLKITDDLRIKESLKTIKYCQDKNCKIILLSHLGKVKTKEDLETKSLKPIAKRLGELLKQDILFIPKTRGLEIEETINKMQPKDILLLENTRFEDLNGNLESNCNEELSKYWASLGDVFINDAFGTCHRNHASNVGISKYIKESGLGFLVLKEMENLLGGAKITDKIKTIKNLVKKADTILIGGAMAYTFLKAKNLEIGQSLVDEDSLTYAKEMLKKHKNIILPIDHIIAKTTDSKEYKITDTILKDYMGLDIGPKTIELFEKYLKNARTIFWNGPMGYYENEQYQTGTKELGKFISNLNTNSIVGGGDTATCMIKMGYKDKFKHISTGGGASLEYLEGKRLPGIN